MPVRGLDSDDLITLDVGNVLADVAAGAFTALILTHLTTTEDRACFFTLQNDDGDLVAAFLSDGVNAAARCGGIEAYQFLSLNTTNWLMTGISKPGGTSVCRFHNGVLNSDASGWSGWSHANGASGGLLPPSTIPCTKLTFGSNVGAVGATRPNHAALVVIWDRVVPDAEMQTWTSAADVQDSGPIFLHQLNQASTGTPTNDLMGNAADQTAISGTTVITDDNPPGFPLDATALPPSRPVVAHRSSGVFSSLGGAEDGRLSTAANALFNTPSNSARLAGFSDYRCIYLNNVGDIDFTDLRVWISSPSAATDVAEAIGEDTSNPAQSIGTETTAPTGVSFSSPASYAAGVALGDLDAGDSIPVWIRRTVSADAAGGTDSFTLAYSWAEAEAPTELPVTYTIIRPLTLYVDADHIARSNARTRLEAGDDPDLPYATMQAAALVAEPGDTIQVEPSTLGNADTSNADDPDMYLGIWNLTAGSTPGVDVLPAADARGGDTINVVGHVVGGVRPKVRRLDFYGTYNWSFSHFQHGFDRGSGDDNRTAGYLHLVGDMTFTDIISTGGGWKCIAADGFMHFDQCETYSPFISGDSQEMNGAGFHILGYDTSTGIGYDGAWLFTSCLFEDVQGEDAIQFSLGGPTSNSGVEISDCTFRDINFGGSGIHTDCIQSLGSKYIKLWRNRFINCDEPIIASDGQNGRISILCNIADGGQNGFWAQGTQEYVAVNNTIRCTYQGVGIGARTNETIPDFVQKLIVVNNVMNYIGVDGGTVIDPDSIVENNIFYSDPGAVTDWGSQLAGLPEFGTSSRVTDIAPLELSTSPVNSPGIGDGRTLAGLGLTSEELAILANDNLGRAFAAPRDVGALQSDPGTTVPQSPRPPYITGRSPVGDVAELDSSVVLTLRPRTGVFINPDSVTADTFHAVDAMTSTRLPAVISISAPAGDGSQTVTLDFKSDLVPITEGELWPRVIYVATIDGIADTEGSTVPFMTWEFRSPGPDGPAIYAPGDEGDFPDLPTGQGVYRWVRNFYKGDGTSIIFFRSNVTGLNTMVRMGETVILDSQDLALMTSLGFIFTPV